MSEYTPDTNLIRAAWVTAHHMDQFTAAEDQFDRWLAARDAEVAAKANREHRAEWADYINNWEGTVGVPMCTPTAIAETLRADHVPFGRAEGDA